MSSGVLLAPLTVALALGVSGVAKLRSGEPADAAFEALRVPRPFRQPLVVRGLPWLEIGLAVTLLLVPHPVSVIVTAVALLLVLAYLVLVLAAVVRRDDVDCHCFGGLASGRVTGATAVRNLLLVVAAGWAFGDALGGHSFVQRLGHLSRPDLSWLAGAALLVGAAALVVWRGDEEPRPEPIAVALAGTDEDGPRAGIPYIELEEPDGTVVSLPELAKLRPVLLVRLSATCSACVTVTSEIGTWQAQVPEVDVRVVTGDRAAAPAAWPGLLIERHDLLRSVLGMHRPSAVLLGADALIAGGPVGAAFGVIGLFEEIRDDLEAMRSAQQS